MQFWKYFQLNLDATYVDEHFVTNPRIEGQKDKVDSFFLTNGKLTIDVFTKKDKIKGKVFVSGENLGNTYYEYKKDYPMPRRNGTVGFAVAFL